MDIAYYTQCPERQIGDKIYSQSVLFNKVPSFKAVSELDLIQQNPKQNVVR